MLWKRAAERGSGCVEGMQFEPMQEKFPDGRFVWVGLGDDAG